MSIKVASLVRKYGPLNHGDFVVLLALADHANDAGGECWPSVKTIAMEMRIGKRSVIRSLKTLATDGWIEVMKKSRDHKGNSYQLVMAKLNSQDTMSYDNPKSDATATPDIGKVRCHTVQSQVPTTSKSGAKSAKPPHPLKGVTVLNGPIQPSKRTQAFVLPDWLPVEPWDHFIEMRASMRKKPTEHAVKLLVKKLDQLRKSGQDPGDILDQSTANGWMGIFHLKGNGNGNLPHGKTVANLAVLNQSIGDRERQDRSDEDGLLSAGSDGPDDTR